MAPRIRPSKDEVWMTLACVLAGRATCERRQVGAVLTNATGELVTGVGYNGNVKGGPNGCDDPTAEGRCGCLHAEMNALLKAPGLQPKVLYVSCAPCLMCAKAAVNANVIRVVYWDDFRNDEGVELLRRCHVPVERIPPWLPKP